MKLNFFYFKRTILTLLFSFFIFNAHARIIYVDSSASGKNNGTSWTDAYTTLKTAITRANSATSIDSILVAIGTYYPTGTHNSNTRNTTFLITRSGIQLYGGFPKGGGSFSQRIFPEGMVQNKTGRGTILSGDIGTQNSHSDNSYHVLTIVGVTDTTNEMIIDGFTITHGQGGANATNTYNGITTYDQTGAGILTMSNNTKLYIINCLIKNNETNWGAGMYNDTCSPYITNCIFLANKVSNYGGGIYNSKSSPIISNCRFLGNNASFGGGVYNITNSSPSFINCDFSGNTVGASGGGMRNFYSSSPKIINCSFYGNVGSIGGILNSDNSNPIITNSIVYGNYNYNIYNAANSNPIVNYSIIQDSLYHKGIGNSTVNPYFNNPNGVDGVAGTLDDDLSLQSCSPALNKGNNNYLSKSDTIDIAGNPRIYKDTVDMGAHEFYGFIKMNIKICQGDSFYYKNQFYKTSTSLIDTFKSSNNCDSILKFTLQVNLPSSSTDVQTACDSFKWIDGKTYKSNNNTATYTLINDGGCDSIITLNLTINHSSFFTDVQTACDSFNWIDGKTYTSSNNFATYLLTNNSGCDSIITLNLTIFNSDSTTDIQTACDSFTWMDGKTYTTNNNTATHILKNAKGCDSVITLDLTILHPTYSTDVQTACDSFTWMDGKTYTSSNKTAIYTLVNSVGCDSIITLDLTVNYSNSSTDIQTACDTFTWIDGNTYTSSNNTATYLYKNNNGCDSVINLNLTIHHSNFSTDIQTSCDSFTWIDGKTYTSSNNTATYLLSTTHGCNSLLILDLTIKTIDKSTTQNGNVLQSNDANGPYQWVDCNDNYKFISGETNSSFTATNNGDYAVIIDNGICKDTSLCLTVQNLGINNLLQKLNFKAYPNPAKDKVYLTASENFTFEIYDAQGKLFLKGNSENNQKTIENLISGFYIIKVQVGEVYSTVKIVVE